MRAAKIILILVPVIAVLLQPAVAVEQTVSAAVEQTAASPSPVAVATMAAERSTEVPAEPNAALARAELYRLIHEVRSIRFSEQAETIGSEKGPIQKQDAAGTTDPNKQTNQTHAEKAATVTKPAADKVTLQAKQVKEEVPLVQDPNAVSNPLEVAEMLYKVGRYKEAAACYRAALKKTPVDKKHDSADADRAWILFQTGNSLAKENHSEAINAYRQLISDYPMSEWTPIAISREQLLQWYIASGIAPTTEKRTLEK
jgi:tetratricopeptide (TPR) repeat protein